MKADHLCRKLLARSKLHCIHSLCYRQPNYWLLGVTSRCRPADDRNRQHALYRVSPSCRYPTWSRTTAGSMNSWRQRILNRPRKHRFFWTNWIYKSSSGIYESFSSNEFDKNLLCTSFPFVFLCTRSFHESWQASPLVTMAASHRIVSWRKAKCYVWSWLFQ
jgi:hypothetical protein